MRPLWGMEGVAGAFGGVGGHGRVKRGLASFLGTMGCRAGARGANDVVVRLSGAGGVGRALGAALGVLGRPRWGPGVVGWETRASHLKVARLGNMGVWGSGEGALKLRKVSINTRFFLHWIRGRGR